MLHPVLLLIFQFFLERLKTYLKDQLLGDAHFTAPEIESILSMNPGKLNDLPKRLQAIRGFTQLSEAAQLAAANKRISNILKKIEGQPAQNVQVQLLRLPAEANLYKALETLSQPIDQFFADVMVMDDDLQLRQNRIALLSQLHQKMNLVADIGKLA